MVTPTQALTFYKSLATTTYGVVYNSNKKSGAVKQKSGAVPTRLSSLHNLFADASQFRVSRATTSRIEPTPPNGVTSNVKVFEDYTGQCVPNSSTQNFAKILKDFCPGSFLCSDS